MRLFICTLWSPAGKGLTSLLSLVVSYCEFVTFPLVSWVRCGTWLYRFLIFAPLFILNIPHKCFDFNVYRQANVNMVTLDLGVLLTSRVGLRLWYFLAICVCFYFGPSFVLVFANQPLVVRPDNLMSDT